VAAAAEAAGGGEFGCRARGIGTLRMFELRVVSRRHLTVLPRERSGLLANSVCFVSKCVLWCFVMFCGVLWVFCGCFVVFCKCFLKNSVLRCFAEVLQCFGRVLRMFFV